MIASGEDMRADGALAVLLLRFLRDVAQRLGDAVAGLLSELRRLESAGDVDRCLGGLSSIAIRSCIAEVGCVRVFTHRINHRL